MGSLLCDIEDINSSQSRSEERLMSITPGRIHDEASFVVSNSFSESLWTLFD